MPSSFAPSPLKLASLALVLSVCFIAGFLCAPNANAQGCPGGTIGSCTDLRFESSNCHSGCCGNPPPGQVGCCTFITYYCTEPVSPAGYRYVWDCNNASCNPNSEGGI
jgi:hypothetical protein